MTDRFLHLKIGVIARTEIARGLAIQTRNFVEHMPVERTLVINPSQTMRIETSV